MEALHELANGTLKEAHGKGIDFASGVTREARDFGMGVPILYWIGWLFVAYFLLYFLSVYVGPALFGTRPWDRPFYWGRNAAVPVGPHFPPNPYMRHRSGAIAGLNEQDSQELTAKVTGAVSNMRNF